MTRGSSKEPSEKRREDPPSGVGLVERPQGGEPTAGEEPAAMESVARRVREITRENERLFQELLTGERRFRKLARAVWRVQEDERRRLARELHDGIGQTLTALKNQLEWLQRSHSESDEALAGKLSESVEMAAQALNDTRELSRLLRPAVLDDLGLAAALGWLVRTVTQRTGLEVDLEIAGLDGRLDAEVETLVFRVVQEALTNVVKHSGANHAEVSVRRRGRRLELRVADRGRGFDPHLALGPKGAAEGVGLRGIQDRAELFDGRLRVDARPGEGAALTITLPLPREPEEETP